MVEELGTHADFRDIFFLDAERGWMVGGGFNQVHPSGLIILLMVLATAVFLKRGFCSWVCPFGLLTEYLNRIHRFIFRKNVRVPRWLDYPLRSLKYLLLAFFAISAFAALAAAAVPVSRHRTGPSTSPAGLPSLCRTCRYAGRR